MTTASQSARGRATAAIVAIVLIVCLTWPTVPGLTSFGRMDSSDGRYSIWNIGWIDHALLTDPRHLLDANIFAPHDGTLAYSELNLVAGALGLPWYAATRNAIAATNGAIVLGLLLAFLAMWALVRRLTGSPEAGLVAATAFTFCPYVQAHTAHIQLLMVFGIPLVFLAFHAFRDTPTLGRAAALGAALAIAALACAYYGIFVGLALGFAGLWFASARRGYWIGLGVAAVVTTLVVLPVFVPYMAARRRVGAPTASSLDQIQTYSATAASYLSSPSYVHEHLPQILRAADESVFPGFLTLALALLGVVSIATRRGVSDGRVILGYLALAGVAAWASFGPGAGLYGWLMKIVPAIGMLRAPVRLGVVVTFAFAVLAGFGVRQLAARRSWLALVLVPLMAAEFATLPWPIVQAAPTIPEAYRILAEKPRGAVVEFPFMYRRTDFHNHSQYMLNSTYHWQPLVNGYSDVVPPGFEDMAAPINGFPDPASFAMMKTLGVKYVVFHMTPRTYDAVSRQKVLDRFPPYAQNLRRLTTDRDVWLYEIVAFP